MEKKVPLIQLVVVTGVASLAGNGLAVRVFLRKGREITIPEILLLNIAVVDLFLAGVSYPAAIVAAFSHRWIFGGIGMCHYISWNLLCTPCASLELEITADCRHFEQISLCSRWKPSFVHF